MAKLDPLNPAGRHSNFVIEASRIVQFSAPLIRDAYARGFSQGMAQPIVMLFDIANRHAAQLAREVAGSGVVDAKLAERDGGSRPDAISLAVCVQPFDWIHAWLVRNGLDEAAAQMERPSSITNIKVQVFASNEIAWLNAERLIGL